MARTVCSTTRECACPAATMIGNLASPRAPPRQYRHAAACARGGRADGRGGRAPRDVGGEPELARGHDVARGAVT